MKQMIFNKNTGQWMYNDNFRKIMRPHNSPLTKSNNIYKSSTMLKKVTPQETIISSNQIESKTKLNTVRSQESIHSTSQRDYNLRGTKKISVQPVENNLTAFKSTQNIRTQKFQRKEGKTEEKAYSFENEDEYIGEWAYDETQKKQKPHGYGCYKFNKQKLEYRGYFRQGVMHGSGTLHRLINRGKPQIIYEGEWMNGQKNGSGKYYYGENLFYEGNWNRNRKQGQGKFKSPEGQYEGLWMNDKKHGRGVLKMKNGTVYDGQWQNDEFVTGQISYSNGDVYRGQVNQQFQRQLQGQYTLGSREQTYKGTWRNNRKQGQGQIIYGLNGEKYTGQMRNDNRVGNNSIYEWKNGTKAICSFENNYPTKGKLILPDNSFFQFDCTQQPNTQNSRR